MCFQALKNSFRAHQWGVNRNFEMRKMPAGYAEPQPAPVSCVLLAGRLVLREAAGWTG